MHQMDTQSTTSLTYFMMYDVLVIRTSSQTPGQSHPFGWSEGGVDPRRGRVDDGWAGCNVGGAWQRPRGLTAALLSPLDRPGAGVIDASAPGEERRVVEGRGSKGACGKWMHRSSSPFCHQTMGL